MKKSDIAIYISAILTLVLTTFVVFSTQKVTYENTVDDLLRNSAVSTNHLAMASPNASSDVQSPLFRNRLPDETSDVRPLKDAAAPQKSDIRDLGAAAPKSKTPAEKSIADAGALVPDMEKKAPARKESIFDDEVQDRIIGKPFTSNAVTERPAAIVTPEVRKSGETAAPKAPSRETADKIDSLKAEQKTEQASFVTPVVARSVPQQQQAAPLKVTQPAAAVPAAQQQQQQAVQTGGDRFHTVAYGDALHLIAARYGTTTLKLIQINNFPNPDLIYPGQKVRLP